MNAILYVNRTGCAWVAERTLAWITAHRHCARDYERLPESHEAMVLRAMIALMTQRLATQAPQPDQSHSRSGSIRGGATVTGTVSGDADDDRTWRWRRPTGPTPPLFIAQVLSGDAP